MLFIFATRKDLSAPIIKLEANRKSLQSEIIFYEQIEIQNNELWSDKTQLNIKYDDKIIIRWPWDASDTSIEYNYIVNYLCARYPKNISLDFECLNKFSPDYEDKYFQYQLFIKLGISAPKVILGTDQLSVESKIGFPIVIKKRISSRSKGNFLIENRSQFEQKIKNLDLSKYIFQEYIRAKEDYRVLVLGRKVLGTVSRYMHLRDGNRLSVKGMENVTKINSKIVSDAKKIQNELGADFVGFDVLIGENRDYFFIEANLSPQFGLFAETTGTNVGAELIGRIIKKNV